MNVTFVTVYKFKMYLSERLKIKFKCTVQVFFRLAPQASNTRTRCYSALRIFFFFILSIMYLNVIFRRIQETHLLGEI